MRRPSFTIQESFTEAKKYSSRSEFARSAKNAYHTLWRAGMLDDACTHMQISPVYSYERWTHQSVFDEAAKYCNRAEFKRSCSGAHGYALTHGILDQACAHMRDGHFFWHVFELMAVAIKYRRKSEFIAKEKSAYNFALKRKLVPLICAHMESHARAWDKPAVLEAARGCQSRGMFQALYSGAYKHADVNGYLDEACAHMAPPEYGFQKENPAVLYQLKITTPAGLILLKVGITNRDPMARVAGMGLLPGVSAELLSVINFASGRDARITEKRLHRKLSSSRYCGPPVMKNGNTELFTVAALEI